MPCHDRQVIESSKAPKPIGPYSVATAGGPFIFTAGQIGLDANSGTLVEGGIESETRQVLMNIKAILSDAHSCMESVMKTTVYLSSMNDFAAMNAVYGEFFKTDPPARTTIQAAGLPKNALVEIDVIAMVCKDGECN